MNDIRQKEREMFNETYKMKQASFEITRNKKNRKKNFERARELQRQETELYKKQQFFRKYLEEMEKQK